MRKIFSKPAARVLPFMKVPRDGLVEVAGVTLANVKNFSCVFGPDDVSAALVAKVAQPLRESSGTVADWRAIIQTLHSGKSLRAGQELQPGICAGLLADLVTDDFGNDQIAEDRRGEHYDEEGEGFRWFHDGNGPGVITAPPGNSSGVGGGDGGETALPKDKGQANIVCRSSFLLRWKEINTPTPRYPKMSQRSFICQVPRGVCCSGCREQATSL